MGIVVTDALTLKYLTNLQTAVLRDGGLFIHFPVSCNIYFFSIIFRTVSVIID